MAFQDFGRVELQVFDPEHGGVNGRWLSENVRERGSQWKQSSKMIKVP